MKPIHIPPHRPALRNRKRQTAAKSIITDAVLGFVVVPALTLAAIAAVATLKRIINP